MENAAVKVTVKVQSWHPYVKPAEVSEATPAQLAATVKPECKMAAPAISLHKPEYNFFMIYL